MFFIGYGFFNTLFFNHASKTFRSTICFPLSEREKQEELDSTLKGTKKLIQDSKPQMPTLTPRDSHLDINAGPGLETIDLVFYQGNCHNRHCHIYNRHKSGEAKVRQGPVRQRSD